MYRIQRRHISSADAEHRKVLLGPITNYSPEMSHISEKDEPFSLSVSLFASPTIYTVDNIGKVMMIKLSPFFAPIMMIIVTVTMMIAKSPFFFLACPPYTETPLSLHLFHSHKLFCPPHTVWQNHFSLSCSQFKTTRGVHIDNLEQGAFSAFSGLLLLRLSVKQNSDKTRLGDLNYPWSDFECPRTVGGFTELRPPIL